MKRSSRLVRSRSFARSGRLNPVSARRQRENAARRTLPQPRHCEIEVILRTAPIRFYEQLVRSWMLPCGGPLAWHERRKRSAGGSILNPDNLVGACNRHNEWVEDNPGLARQLGGTRLVVREGDPEYEALSKRWDE